MIPVPFLGQKTFFSISYYHPALEIMLMKQHKPILCYFILMSDILAFHPSKHHMPSTIKQECRES